MNKQIAMIVELPKLKDMTSEEVDEQIRSRLVQYFSIEGVSIIKSLHINARPMIEEEIKDEG